MPKRKPTKTASRRVTKSVRKQIKKSSLAPSPYSFSQAFFVVAGVILILTGAIFIAHDKEGGTHSDLTQPTTTPVEDSYESDYLTPPPTYAPNPELETKARDALTMWLEGYKSSSHPREDQIRWYKIDEIKEPHIKDGELRWQIELTVMPSIEAQYSNWLMSSGVINRDGSISKGGFMHAKLDASGTYVTQDGIATGAGRDF